MKLKEMSSEAIKVAEELGLIEEERTLTHIGGDGHHYGTTVPGSEYVQEKNLPRIMLIIEARKKLRE